MDCERAERKLKAWIDGELDESALRLLDGHVESCPACREKAVDYRAIGYVLRKAKDPVPVSRVKAGEVRRIVAKARREEERLIGSLQRTALAAAALLIVSTGLSLLPAASVPDDRAGRERLVSEEVSDDDALAAFFFTSLEASRPLHLEEGY